MHTGSQVHLLYLIKTSHSSYVSPFLSLQPYFLKPVVTVAVKNSLTSTGNGKGEWNGNGASDLAIPTFISRKYVTTEHVVCSTLSEYSLRWFRGVRAIAFLFTGTVGPSPHPIQRQIYSRHLRVWCMRMTVRSCAGWGLEGSRLWEGGQALAWKVSSVCIALFV